MNENVEALLKKYDAELDRNMVIKFPDVVPESVLIANHLCHVRWMIKEMFDNPEKFEGNTRKVNRWLGFMQGVMWAFGKKQILELRDESRDLYKD